MEGIRAAISRRGLLTAVVAGSAVGVAGAPAAAFAVDDGPMPSGPLTTHDRIGGAVTRTPAGRAVAFAYSPDFHDRLGRWLGFWWANSPSHWLNPLEVVGEVQRSGRVLLLEGIRYTYRDRLHDGFAAGSRDAAYWATVASLHHHFPVVRADPASGRIRVEDGHPGFTGTADQIDFVRAACRYVWAGNAASTDWRTGAAQVIGRTDPADLTRRAGWSAFTKATVRRGLGTQ